MFRVFLLFVLFFFFFFNDTATTEIYTLSLHDALPIKRHLRPPNNSWGTDWAAPETATRRKNHLRIWRRKRDLGLCNWRIPTVIPVYRKKRRLLNPTVMIRRQPGFATPPCWRRLHYMPCAIDLRTRDTKRVAHARGRGDHHVSARDHGRGNDGADSSLSSTKHVEEEARSSSLLGAVNFPLPTMLGG